MQAISITGGISLGKVPSLATSLDDQIDYSNGCRGNDTAPAVIPYYSTLRGEIRTKKLDRI